MQTPEFWFRRSWQSRLLAPLGWLYAWGTAHRLAKGAPETLSIPVICVGNINAGGTGKTPTAIYLVQKLQEMGHQPHIVSRGYGGHAVGPLRVNEREHRADEVGDEPLLLSAFGPVWVAKNRLKGARAAEAAGASIILLDDGFQDPSLTKTLSLVVVDAARGFGNERCIPAGPLREPLHVGLKRADAVLAIGEGDATLLIEKPLFSARLEPLQMGMSWEGTRALAFAGIGHPEKFFATLSRLGAEIVHAEALSDHQPLTPALMQRLLSDAKRHGARLVTTEKDAVRLPPALRSEVLTLPVRLTIKEEQAFDALLKQKLGI